MKVEVVYALRERQMLVPLELAEGATVRDAIDASQIMIEFPEIDLAVNKVGIFGKLVRLDTVLREQDRVEIYRQLLADPKEVRRKRAAEGRPMKKGAGGIED